MARLVTIVIPFYNEQDNLPVLLTEVSKTMNTLAEIDWQVLLVNDGSTDNSSNVIVELQNQYSNLQYLEFSRNFGKEAALSAGLHGASGDAVIMMDADMQHPPSFLPELIKAWQAGSEVVVGVRKQSSSNNLFKKTGAKFFYWLMNQISSVAMVPHATDFRLLTREVVEAFSQLSEKQRLTRGLIDWLGYKTLYVTFDAPARNYGQSHYGFFSLVGLALRAIVSQSLFPLRIAGYLGASITILSGVFGIFIFVEKYILHDPWNLNFSGPAILAVINLFLIGIVLSALGLIALYIASIHGEVIGRPLYVIRKQK